VGGPVQDDFSRAAALFEESLALRRTLGQVEGLSDLLCNGALIAVVRGDYARARALLEESLAQHRADGNLESIGRGGLGLSLYRLAMVLRTQGDNVRATALLEECLALHREWGDREGIALVLLGLGDIARDQGDPGQVRVYCSESLALFEELQVTWGRGFALNNLALAAYQEGELALALALAEDSVALFRSLEVGMSLAEALTTLGRIVGAMGDAARAQVLLVEALALAWVKGTRWFVAAGLEELAVHATAQRQAARLYAAAATLRAAMGAPLPVYLYCGHARALAAVRTELGEDAFSAAWTAGEALPLAEAVDEARAMTPRRELPGHGVSPRWRRTQALRLSQGEFPIAS
jgi:tetratricopeptide (TPR) repeat protein